MPVFKLGSVTTYPGGYFDVPLVIETSPEIRNFELDLRFDERFVLKDVVGNGRYEMNFCPFSGGLITVNGNPDGVPVRDECSEVAVLRFRTEADSEIGPGNIDIVDYLVYSSSGESIEVDVVRCTVNVRKSYGKRLTTYFKENKVEGILLISIILVALIASVALADHMELFGHHYVHYDSKDPTCTEVGWDEYDVCSKCGHSTYREIPAMGHDPVYHDAKVPTCTEVGWDVYETCSRCDYTTYREVPALGHDPVFHDAKKPTCDEVGWFEYDTCTICDHSTYTEIGPVDHVYAATRYGFSGSEGTAYTCIVCGGTIVLEEPVDVPAGALWAYGADGEPVTVSVLEAISVPVCPGDTVRMPLVVSTDPSYTNVDIRATVVYNGAFTLESVDGTGQCLTVFGDGSCEIGCGTRLSGGHGALELVFTIGEDVPCGRYLIHLESAETVTSGGEVCRAIGLDAILDVTEK
ncbi:MAG: hypothetical protein MJZ68_02690 [archaeon]|nr:hypothetical protein [archaeon]